MGVLAPWPMPCTARHEKGFVLAHGQCWACKAALCARHSVSHLCQVALEINSLLNYINAAGQRTRVKPTLIREDS